ncbi:MAG: chromosomal replication initiator protein DnaA [Lachnospiraceae bacterium]|nr:chromosomal replication initiator protein DnaA [Lachnospiraceae bacterium]
MERIIKDRWNDILNYIKEENSINQVCFNTWLLNINAHSLDEEKSELIISINDDIIGIHSKNYMENRYGLLIKVAIEVITGFCLTLKFYNKSELNITTDTPLPPKNKSTFSDNSINNKYTFDTFVVGNNNSFAHAASLAVAESPGKTEHNPLFIYGSSGLGKTHLINSIANYIRENSPELNVLYVTSEQYTTEIVSAMRNSKQDRTVLESIKNKYREVDVLIIDDIQFIIGKDITQEEFFHTFTTLYELGKQIILTSDKHPNLMDKLDERYRSRFTWGIPVDIKPPEYETRLAILRKKEEESSIKLGDAIIKLIAENIKTNIRDIEGAYNKLILRSRLQHENITVNTAMDDIKDLILTDENVKITNDYIINIIINHYGISLEEITSKNRSKKIAKVRFICMYLCRKITNSTYDEIGEKLGGKDRTSVMHGHNKIEEELKEDAALQKEIEILKKIINHQE